jgi:hypothetical protein
MQSRAARSAYLLPTHRTHHNIERERERERETGHDRELPEGAVGRALRRCEHRAVHLHAGLNSERRRYLRRKKNRGTERERQLGLTQ